MKNRSRARFFIRGFDRVRHGWYKPRMAVYTHLTNEAIAQLLAQHYAVGTLDFAIGIAQGVENTNYLIGVHNASGAEQKYILTLYEKRTRAEDLPFFLELMQHLAARGVNCPQPILRTDGSMLSTVGGKHAALVSFLHGKSRSIARNPHVAQVGQALGQLHVAAQDFGGDRPNALSLEGWQALYQTVRDRLDAIQPNLQHMIDHELRYLMDHWPPEHALPRGVIHADLFPDNVFFTEDDVSGVIDFYFACTDFFAYDLAITINAWCFEPSRECNLTKIKLLLNHYQRQRPLSAAEKHALPTLLRGAALRFLLTRAHDWLHHEKSALVTPKDPLEYVVKLRFHQGNKDASIYGW